jgi:hypothetical protein
MSMESPNIAPARVDWTRCETPTAAPAKRSPGPKADQNERAWAGAFMGGKVDKMRGCLPARRKETAEDAERTVPAR